MNEQTTTEQDMNEDVLMAMEAKAMSGLEKDVADASPRATAGMKVIRARQASGRDPGQIYWAWLHEVGTQHVDRMQDRPAYGSDDAAFEEAWSRFHGLLPCNQA